MTNYAGFEAQAFYKTESSEGVTPAGQWLALAHKANAQFSDSPSPNFTKKSGSVDNAKPTKGIPSPTVNIDFTPSLGSGKAFIKSFASTDTSFSLLLVKIDVSNFVFYRITGCKVKRTNCKGQLWPNGSDISCSMEIWVFNTIATDEGSTPSYETVPDTVLSWSNVTIKTVADPSGTNPARSTITQWNNFDWTIENDLYRIPDKDGNTTAIKRGERQCFGSFEFIITGNSSTDITATQTAAYQDIEFLFSSDSYLFNDCAYTTINLGFASGQMAIKKLDFHSASLVIS